MVNDDKNCNIMHRNIKSLLKIAALWYSQCHVL